MVARNIYDKHFCNLDMKINAKKSQLVTLPKSMRTYETAVTLISKKIRKTIEKRVKYDLHYSTLTTYLTSNSVPKGLSLKLNPAMTTLNREEQLRWENTLQDTSLQLMQIIIQHSERKSRELKEAELSLRRQSDLREEYLNDLVEYEKQQ